MGKRFYCDYRLWEDYKAGMYNKKVTQSDVAIQKAMFLLSNESELYNAMLYVINNWQVSSRVNLGHKGCNRQAWLGQAACCHKYGVPEILTKHAWNFLTDEQRVKANAVADRIIILWEQEWGKKNC